MSPILSPQQTQYAPHPATSPPPFSLFMGGRIRSCMVEMHDPPPVVSQNQEHVQDLEANGRHGKKVNRHHRLDVIFQEGPPGLRQWPAAPRHVLAHARFPDVDAQFEQFTMDTRRTPEWILPAHPAN